MRNITVSVPDEVYRRAKVLAARRDTSVSAMVSEMLAAMEEGASRAERLKALQREVLAEIESFRVGDRLSRDEVHERALR